MHSSNRRLSDFNDLRLITLNHFRFIQLLFLLFQSAVRVGQRLERSADSRRHGALRSKQILLGTTYRA